LRDASVGSTTGICGVVDVAALPPEYERQESVKEAEGIVISLVDVAALLSKGIVLH
jgi:hypothetical protein